MMADLEAVLADVSYLMAMEMSKSAPPTRTSKKICLPEPSIRNIMMRYLEKSGELTFEKCFQQRLGYLIFKDFCLNFSDEPVPQIQFYEDIKQFERLETDEERISLAKTIYDQYIMKGLLSFDHNFSEAALTHVQDRLISAQRTKLLQADTFAPYIEEISDSLRGSVFESFVRSHRFTRFCQWKNLELNLNLSTNDFSIHRIIGRGGFGEVYGCRKADTGKMYAMKCLDKKRIKMKGGESLALNERLILLLVSTGEGCPFIVCMTYAFQTTDKLCFVLDLMNGGDLHYHLNQHNVFSEIDVRFYAAEVILGLEHMHNRFIVYRDLKPANILLDEHGHIRISDLGLACDFSVKKPHASVGTHGYMAPEVLQSGRAYDSSADWFSLGCMLYKLLRGHSPFRHQKMREKQEIDRLTMHADVKLPDDLSPEMNSLLLGLLTRDTEHRLGCMGRGAYEVKEHPFFGCVDWQLVYLRKYSPPLLPPRGEVNAADAFEIGAFDEDDTKSIKLTEADQQLYAAFSVVVSERWQTEVAEAVFDVVNQETDRLESKRRSKPKSSEVGTPAEPPEVVVERSHAPDSLDDCIVDGAVLKVGGPFFQAWQRRYLRLFPNRLEFYSTSRDGVISNKGVELVSMFDIREISPTFQRAYKMDNCIVIILKNGSKILISSNDKVSISQWKDEILEAFQTSNELISHLNWKVHKMYGTGSTESLPKSPYSGTTHSMTCPDGCNNSVGGVSTSPSNRVIFKMPSVHRMFGASSIEKSFSCPDTEMSADIVEKSLCRSTTPDLSHTDAVPSIPKT